MIIEAARLAASELLRPRFRSVMLKSIGLTILLFIAAWIGLEYLFSTFLLPFLGGWPWVATAAVWLLGAGVFIGAGFLLGPVTAVFAGIFLDEAAEHVEETWYGDDPPGRPIPLPESLWLTTRFTLLVIFANLIALLLVLLPGINFAIFFLVNGYLLGREYFTLAAIRRVGRKQAKVLRSRYAGTIWMAGFLMAIPLSVPLLNLVIPIVGAATFTHLFHRLSQRGPSG